MNNKDHNVIPRNFDKIIARQLTQNNAGQVGDTFEIRRNEFNDLIGTNTRTGEKFVFFISHLRNKDEQDKEHYYYVGLSVR